MSGLGCWRTLMGVLTPKKAKTPDRREYTLMVVPHHGRKVISLRIPIAALKISAAVISIILIISVGTFISYRHAVNEAAAEKEELNRLRQVNAVQNSQIEQLAQATAMLQDDMSRLNKLDADLRRLVNNEEEAASRSGGVRPPTTFSGQGGPVVKPRLSELNNLLQDLQKEAKAREQSLTAMREQIIERNSRKAATPSIWPASGDVTSRFGWRGSPWGWGGDWHPGIDIANDYGTPIVATADGVVVASGWNGGYGIAVEIDHGNGITTLYGHNSETLVTVGDKVKKGDTISYMGSTGYSTGSHVHYEVKVNGAVVNPANFL